MSTNQILATVHRDHLPFVKAAKDEELAQYVRAQILQSLGEEVPVLTGWAKALFEAHTELIERLDESRRKKSEAGKQGGNPHLKQGKPDAEQSKAEVKQEEAEHKQEEALLKQCLSNDKAELKPNTVSYSVSNSVSDNNSVVVVGASASEEDFARVSWHYGESIGPFPLPSKVSAGIQGYLDCMEPAVIIDAINEAAAENKRSWSYVRGILSNRKQAGIRNMADVARDKAEHDNARASPGASKRGKNKGVSNDPNKHGAPTAENLANMERLLNELRASEVEEPPKPPEQPKQPAPPTLAESIGITQKELERIQAKPPDKPEPEPTEEELSERRLERIAKLEKMAAQP